MSNTAFDINPFDNILECSNPMAFYRLAAAGDGYFENAIPNDILFASHLENQTIHVSPSNLGNSVMSVTKSNVNIDNAASGGVGGQLNVKNSTHSKIVGNTSRISYYLYENTDGTFDTTPNANIYNVLDSNDSYFSSLRFDLYGQEVMRLSAAGNLGVGVTNPDVRVQVSGDVRTAQGNTTRSLIEVVPAGSIIAFGGAFQPVGWLICDGRYVSKTEYADLFSALGTRYGDGGSTFGIPNLQDMFIRGLGSGRGVGDVQGDTYRSHDHPASSAHNGTHSHSGNTQTTGRHNHSGNTQSAGTHNHSGNTQSTGRHNHGATIAQNGSHTHGASTGPEGGHDHTGTAAFSGDHTHSYYEQYVTWPTPYSGKGENANEVRHQAPGSGDGYRLPLTQVQFPITQPAGGHSHTVTISGNGEHTHTVTIASNGAHDHSISIADNGEHQHVINSDGVHQHVINDDGDHRHVIDNDGNHNHSITVFHTGSGETRPINMALYYIIKT